MATVRERMEGLLNNEDTCDIEFLVQFGGETEKIKGHKVIFAVSSKIFDDMMTLHSDEGKNEVIRIEEVSPEAFHTLKRFIYTDRSHFNSVPHARSVYEASIRYGLDQLAKEAKDYLLANVPLEAVIAKSS